ncbi:protein ENHANCED DISEASE RESISTANCE 4 [Ziziphus jujuba]|uniref:Protein ENHANCED DISEASE RESISTANCE 4 n=1 Tax=Ziziphus jujuba TaxID=326968 RepID=A0A6P4A774_ZIZJJ|nr:protein ENHANCED DISEASE RESISTANCE 4 [Ziziphus jujuba]
MEESAKVRLVRCPKCENLLPELADYSVYQCGGCGAVLRAKSKRREGDTLSEKSEEERVGVVSVKSDNSLEKRAVELCDASDSDVKSSGGSLRCDQSDFDIEKEDVKNTEKYRNQSKVTAEKWIVENGLDMNLNRDCELGNAMAGREHGHFSTQVGPTNANQRSARMSDWRIGDGGEMEEPWRNPKTDVEGVRFSTSNYADEGSSNYQLGSSYGFGEPVKKHNDPDGPNRAQYLEHDRAELLKKLDELRDQLSRSCDLVDKTKEKVPLDARVIPPDPYGGSDSWFPDAPPGANRASMQFFRPDKHVGPSQFNHYTEPYPYTNGHEIPARSFYPSMHNPHRIPGYGDPFGSQMLNGGPQHFPKQYQQPSHPYFSTRYVDTNPDPFEPLTQNAMFHQPTCSCYHCYEKHRRVSAPVPSTAFCNNRFPDVSSNPMPYHHEKPGAFGPFDPTKSRTAVHSNLHVLQPHTRRPSDINSDLGHVRSRPRRIMLASGGRRCRPIFGGAPFLTCSNCSEVLQLPRRVLHMVKNQQKMQCGTCSTVIDFAVVDKKIVLSGNPERYKIPTVVNNSFNEVIKDGTSNSHNHVNRTYANFSSDDYDNSGYDFQSIDREPVSLSIGSGLNSNKPQEMQSFHSSSPCMSDDENSPEVPSAQREVTSSMQRSIKAALSPPPPGSPLQEHFDYSSNNYAGNRFGKGNRSSRSDQEKVKSNKATSRQNSLKEASLATEMEVSFNEYSNTGISQDSGDASRDDYQPKSNKGGESFLTNIIKKSFRDFSRSNQTDDRGKSNISINGHLIPERVIKKAEKLAGPIHPGQYWYDFRAGFWGVMDGPCLGIIPPFIEEFNYPMPESCSAGNTGVFVNGRELHQKDLDLLAGRGLPTARDRSYIIEISGKVLDVDTGEELDGLGKLAPTVEKAKHGFGMKPPRAAA